MSYRDPAAERGRGAEVFSLTVGEARSHEDDVWFELGRSQSLQGLNDVETFITMQLNHLPGYITVIYN